MKHVFKVNDSHTCLFERKQMPKGNIAVKIIPLKNRIELYRLGSAGISIESIGARVKFLDIKTD